MPEIIYEQKDSWINWNIITNLITNLNARGQRYDSCVCI